MQRLSKIPLISGSNRPLGKIYVGTALPLFGSAPQAEEIYRNVSVSKIISDWDAPVLDYGYQFIHYKDGFSVQSYETAQVIRWLPFKAAIAEVENYISNRRVYSNVLPVYPRDLYIEQGLAREAILKFMQSQKDVEISERLLATGSIFATSPFLSQSLLILLDSLDFKGKLDLFLDRRSCLVPLGILRQYERDVFNLVPDALLPSFLGSVLRFGDSVQVKINLELPEPLRVNVERGNLFMFPLKAGERATVTVVEKNKKTTNWELSGGELGFVIDCRGHPSDLPSDPRRRISLLKEWEEAVGATGRIYSV